MKKAIQNPFSVNHRIYRWIIFFSVFGIIISSVLSYIGCGVLCDIIKNISYGCFASTIVAWLLELYNVREKNQKANNIYDAVYSDLKFCIKSYIETWAQICTIAYKEDTSKEDIHTWLEWYGLCKTLFYKCDEKRQKEIMDFFVPQLRDAVERVNKAIQGIVTQSYMLTINDVYNDEVKNIVEDFRFEFYAADLDLKRDNSHDYFWESMDAINADLKNYINAWVDIRFYNNVRFNPHGFFKDKQEILRAILET